MKKEKSFEVITLSREDLESIGYKKHLKDFEMEYIANKLGEALMEFYWEDLKIIVDSYLENKNKRSEIIK